MSSGRSGGCGSIFEADCMLTRLQLRSSAATFTADMQLDQCAKIAQFLLERLDLDAILKVVVDGGG